MNILILEMNILIYLILEKNLIKQISNSKNLKNYFTCKICIFKIK